MTDKEIMQMALDALELVTDLTNHDDEVYAAIEALRARLAQPEPVLVSPKEFIAAVTGKWDISGIPALMSVWPTPEEARPEPEHRDVVIAGDLWRVEFLPDNDANVRLVKANYTTKQEKQEPVAWMHDSHVGFNVPLYTAPPQRECVSCAGLCCQDYEKCNLPCTPRGREQARREWQTLTENEIKHLWYEACQTNLELTSQLIVHLARNIEAKLKENNNEIPTFITGSACDGGPTRLPDVHERHQRSDGVNPRPARLVPRHEDGL